MDYVIVICAATSSDWTISVSGAFLDLGFHWIRRCRGARISAKGVTTIQLREMCDERGLKCPGGKPKMFKTLAGNFMGPDFPVDGLRVCHRGAPINYRTEMRILASLAQCPLASWSRSHMNRRMMD